jgi:hypothetical protein
VRWPPATISGIPLLTVDVPRLDQRAEGGEGLSEAAVAAIVFAVAACLLPLAVLLAKLCIRFR